jgi:class 3 adenylate cyclase/nitrite reductase/ring-hydroxylating ferredoxin subunit
MVQLRSLPDDVEFEVVEGESVLEASRRANLPLANACGGKAKCSTCRIWLLDGADDLPPPNEAEAEMIERLGLAGKIRLACQLRPKTEFSFRRLVLDETDLRTASQLHRSSAAKAGTLKPVVIFFSDVSGFTSFSESLTPYDVMYILNRYFSQVGEYIESNDGFIDKFVGDGLMAIFGVEDQHDAPVRAVNAALQTLAAVDRLKPFFKSMYDIDFDIRIGLHYGEAVIGSVGSPGNERLTAIGNVVNVASRVEVANKEAGTRFLISEPLYERVKSDVDMTDFVRVLLRGMSERMTLYEIAGLTEEANRLLNDTGSQETFRSGGITWTKALASDDLKEDNHKVLDLPDFDVVVTRRNNRVYAFNNACPHLKLPFYDRSYKATGPGAGASKIDANGRIYCRWHESCFDMDTGEIVEWCTNLQEDGTSQGMEQLGDISKNRSELTVVPCREDDGYIWLGLELE